MPDERQEGLCAFHFGLTDDPEECRTGCQESDARRRARAGAARLAPHLDLAETIAKKAAEIRAVVGNDPWGAARGDEQ